MNNMLKYILNGGNERARIERKQQEEWGEILNNKVGDYTIDSLYTFDQRLWNSNMERKRRCNSSGKIH
jgi:hypothetical protein